MNTLREAAQQALEALERADKDDFWREQHAAITALKAALAEPVQEPECRHGQETDECGFCYDEARRPVAWMWEETAPRSSTGIGGIDRKLLFCRPADEPWKRNITPLYTAPPQRKPLTDEEIHDCWQQRHRDKTTERRLITRAIEQAHGIKDAGCDHCNHPLYAATKCKNCGRVTE